MRRRTLLGALFGLPLLSQTKIDAARIVKPSKPVPLLDSSISPVFALSSIACGSLPLMTVSQYMPAGSLSKDDHVPIR